MCKKYEPKALHLASEQHRMGDTFRFFFRLDIKCIILKGFISLPRFIRSRVAEKKKLFMGQVF